MWKLLGDFETVDGVWCNLLINTYISENAVFHWLLHTVVEALVMTTHENGLSPNARQMNDLFLGMELMCFDWLCLSTDRRNAFAVHWLFDENYDQLQLQINVWWVLHANTESNH